MDPAKIDSIDLAKLILAKRGPMPHLKLQKLLYYIEAWHLAYFQQSIISDQFKAWVHGPVSTKVWHHFKDAKSPLFKDLSIPRHEALSTVGKVQKAVSPDQLALINDVLDEYGGLGAYELEGLTHSEAPWIEARRGLPVDESSSREIPKDRMLRFYRQRLYRK